MGYVTVKGSELQLVDPDRAPVPARTDGADGSAGGGAAGTSACAEVEAAVVRTGWCFEEEALLEAEAVLRVASAGARLDFGASEPAFPYADAGGTARFCVDVEAARDAVCCLVPGCSMQLPKRDMRMHVAGHMLFGEPMLGRDACGACGGVGCALLHTTGSKGRPLAKCRADYWVHKSYKPGLCVVGDKAACTNTPVACPACEEELGAGVEHVVLWKYGMELHYAQQHKGKVVPEELIIGPKEKKVVKAAWQVDVAQGAAGPSKRARRSV